MFSTFLTNHTYVQKYLNARKFGIKIPYIRHNYFYYIDTSVLLENIPLVEFIKTTSGTRVVYFP